MKEQLKKLILDYPRHYVRFLKKNSELLEWVKSNTKTDSTDIAEMAYSALYDISNKCENGKSKNFVNIMVGFRGCGPARDCPCTKSNISKSVSNTKLNFSEEDREKIQKKRNETMLHRYGYAFNSQRPDIHYIWKKPKINQEVFEKLNDNAWLDREYNELGRSAVDIAQELNVYYGTVIEYCSKHGFDIRKRSNYSLVEIEIMKFLDSYNIQYEHCNYSVIGKELDIFIPAKNLAIEIDGLYWHSYHPDMKKPENKFRHIEKTGLAREKGVNLIHITDFEWINKRPIIEAILLSKLNLNSRIFARNCSLKEVDNRVAKEFLEKYHLQGFAPHKIAVGLFYNDELLSLMTVAKSRFDKNIEWELLRYCTKAGVTIVGGGSKMLTYLKKTLGSIVSYCDLAKSNGKSYENMGFKSVKDTNPGYFWTDGNNIISRYKSQKNNLKRWLTTYNEALTEEQNMFGANFRRFHDCGHRVFIME